MLTSLNKSAELPKVSGISFRHSICSLNFYHLVIIGSNAGICLLSLRSGVLCSIAKKGNYTVIGKVAPVASAPELHNALQQMLLFVEQTDVSSLGTIGLVTNRICFDTTIDSCGSGSQ